MIKTLILMTDHAPRTPNLTQLGWPSRVRTVLNQVLVSPFSKFSESKTTRLGRIEIILSPLIF
jgi:hypothetical protein